MHEKDAQRMTVLLAPGAYHTTADARELEQLKRQTSLGKHMATKLPPATQPEKEDV
jgi:hypothetical protein